MTMCIKPRLRCLASFIAGLGLLVLSADADASHPDRSQLPRMPDLSRLSLRTDPRVLAEGQIIKGLYYGAEPSGPNELVAFYNACDHRLEDHPFLILDFGTQRYYFDANRDGRLDETGAEAGSIDPASYALRATAWSASCYRDDGR